ncbi:MAG: type I DNA topoisomerase, partial [Saprospiraceae bacterium]
MSKKLLIVESPAKAKTIEKILGSDFTVKSSYGHIRDLDKGNKAVDIENGFAPKYIVSPEKARVVKELKEHMAKADEVWLATDEDREGEAISWHLCEVLGLNVLTTPRIVFREITKPAILKAVNNPRRLDINLVNAQQARRILDRLVGYELSEILWRKIKGKLSAGRVQSVAVKLIVDREREIQQFEESAYFRVTAVFEIELEGGKKAQVKAVLSKEYKAEGEAKDFLQRCIGATYSVAKVEVKPAKRKPAAPFTTSTLQQEASRKLGFAVKRTMMAAQRLYESGHISYMRTDSNSLSEEAISNIAAEIENQFGKEYVEIRRYKTKNESAQEAHEAIRPTYITTRNVVSTDTDQEKLYDLIWRRTIASQMSDAILEKTQVDIAISTIKEAMFLANGEVLIFDGFLKVYLESRDEEEDDENQKLPPMKVGMPLQVDTMTATEKFSRPPARYTEASLVKKLEELGIGRPSTYVPTISKIMEDERGYVTKESRDGLERKYQVLQLEKSQIVTRTATEITGTTKNRLYPSDIGMLVTDFLHTHFDDVMDYGFTADIEKRFDKIADGDLEWPKMLSAFYGPFHADVE